MTSLSMQNVDNFLSKLANNGVEPTLKTARLTPAVRAANDRVELSLSRLAAPQKRREQVVRAVNSALRGFRPRSANADASRPPAAALRVSAQLGRSVKEYDF